MKHNPFFLLRRHYRCLILSMIFERQEMIALKKDIKAIVLAAGVGSRIANIFDSPKSLLKIKGRSLLEWHLGNFSAVNIRDVVFVLGYKKEEIIKHISSYDQEFNFSFIENDDFINKGNTYSLYKGLEKTDGNILIIDADLIYEAKVLQEFVSDLTRSQILVGECSLDDIECTKTLVDGSDHVRKLVDKRAVTEDELSTLKFFGEAIGLLKFTAHDASLLKNKCQKFLSQTSNLLLNWEYLINEFIVDHDVEMHYTLSRQWIEIDDEHDYQKAKKLFEGKSIHE